ncbi:hypothetical protein [Erythrobacter sp. MTPC3]|uniref:hypothetical protein n=1 Tax=Erythrobacter sp. MTPC3 TaxID=3056564 RepID=UPI0036F2F53C
MSVQKTLSRRGSPLAMLVAVLAVWAGGRAMTWEDPFAQAIKDIAAEVPFLARDETGALPGDVTVKGEAKETVGSSAFLHARAVSTGDHRFAVLGVQDRGAAPAAADALGHELLWLRAMGAKLPVGSPHGPRLHGLETPQSVAGVTPLAPAFEGRPAADRWSLDAWAFWRQGSNAAPISQGRVPIYGASQAGANLQYRVDPASRFDPRVYMRGYRALVSGGETEIAAGASARPFASIPLRVSAEVRAAENRFGQTIRPAVIATTELPAARLPASFRLEAYGGAGYVGGKGATPFADGQIAVTRELADIAGPVDTRAQVSIGAGAWGGAQKDASRVDVGPTMRVDMTIGKVPARLALDWREQITGDAAPGSGVAATLSTRF